MHAVQYHEYGDASVLRSDESTDRNPPRADVRQNRSRLRDPVDTKLREELLEPTARVPHVTGTDLAGVVEFIGEGVTAVEPDERVYGTRLGWTDQRTYAEYAEYAEVPADRLGSVPESVSFKSAATAAME